MTVEIDPPPAHGRRISSRAGNRAAPTPFVDGHAANSLVVAIINNMPDAAVEGTETQFASLLRAASGSLALRLRFSSLPEIPRAPAVRRRFKEQYWDIEDLYCDPPDAIIVTGTEPKAHLLTEEPYWDRFVDLIEFARSETRSSIWSCLAAHVAVLHLDGVERQRLNEKCCGVYVNAVSRHPLTAGLPTLMPTPHSRWNDLPVDRLKAAGYVILSESPEAGADAFIKSERSLMLFFQGHPEYEDRTLLKEYQRDVGRFVTGAQGNYPTLPVGYFQPEARALLTAFERDVLRGQNAEALTDFPFSRVAQSIVNGWSAPAARIYANWLQFIATGMHSTRAAALVLDAV
jgi:homoserine O-succinyltransferase/O-acetyltransferase